MEVIFFIENTTMLCLLNYNFKGNDLVVGAGTAAYCIILVGVIFKVIYYCYFHIWQDTIFSKKSTPANTKTPEEILLVPNDQTIGETEFTEDHLTLSISIVDETQTDCRDPKMMKNLSSEIENSFATVAQVHVPVPTPSTDNDESESHVKALIRFFNDRAQI